MTEEVTVKQSFREKLSEARYRIVGGLSLAGVTLTGYAHAAVNFTPITELINAVTGLIPSLMDLVIAMAPLKSS